MDTSRNDVVKKKRGRKPKESKLEVLSTTNVPIVQNLSQHHEKEPQIKIIDNDGIDTVVKVKGKRGRKPKSVYTYESTDDTNNISSLSDDENIIVRLNIMEQDDNEVDTCTEEQPYAYNHDTYSTISNIDDFITMTSQDRNSKIEIDKLKPNINNLRVINVLKDFEEKNKHNEWPLNTSISCYWCCHRFENAPFGIPINYTNNCFQVYGCFCSLECAAAYNFDSNNGQDEMWERYQLLNVISRKMKMGNVVKSAPPRLSLKIFGGHLDIETFRNYTNGNKFINVNFPPMTSITQQLEEINDFEISNDFKYIPVDNERINKYKEKIVFKRNKPLIDSNKSLETTMNLKYM